MLRRPSPTSTSIRWRAGLSSSTKRVPSLRAGLVALAEAEAAVATAVGAVGAATTMVTSQEVAARSRAGRPTVQDAGTTKWGKGLHPSPFLFGVRLTDSE